MSPYASFSLILWGSLVLTGILAVLKLLLQNREHSLGYLGQISVESRWKKVGWLTVLSPFILGWFYLTWPYVYLILLWNA